MRATIAEAALTLSRWVELSIVGKATVMMLLGLIAARLAGHARASLRHLLLAATFATLLALPLVVVTAPGLTIGISVAQVSDLVDASSAIRPPDTLVRSASGSPGPRTIDSGHWSMPSWSALIRSVWIAGAVLMIISLMVDLWRVRRLRRNGLPWTQVRELTQTLATGCGLRRPVEVLLHEDIRAPLTCGVWHPLIVLPSDASEWAEADLRRALVHELEHARRGDWATQLAARAVCACYWFHPLVWVAWRRLCLEAERACDDAVVLNAEHTAYAEQLVLLSRRLSSVRAQPILGMANRSDLSRRVSALLDSSQRRGRAGLLVAASAIIVAGSVLMTIAPLRAVARATNLTAANRDTRAQTDNQRKSVSTPFDRALFDAAENGNTSDITKLLNAGANVNCALDGDGSPLIAAARNGHQAAVELLLDRGADPNMPVRGDGNPLIIAAREGHAEIVRLLLDRGANIDQIVPGDENALIQASSQGHLVVVKVLVGRGADVNARVWVERTGQQPNGEWRTPLSMARKGGHSEVIAYLLSLGVRE
ncbi:MAG: M56 family metallopeptidase [Pyrinomonadaceae bacterium]